MHQYSVCVCVCVKDFEGKDMPGEHPEMEGEHNVIKTHIIAAIRFLSFSFPFTMVSYTAAAACYLQYVIHC